MTVLPASKNSKRHFSRVIGVAAAVAVLSIAAACSSDSVTAPQMQAANSSTLLGGIGGLANGVLSGLIPSKGLLRTVSLTSPIVASQVMGRNGGTIELPGAGLKLTVPSGAITGSPITITITAIAGNTVAYEFLPHGTQFARPLQFEQTLEGTNWDKLKVKATVVGGYFKLLDQVNLLTGLALLDETYPITVQSNRVRFDITHFSGYMVSTGRSDSSDDAQF